MMDLAAVEAAIVGAIAGDAWIQAAGATVVGWSAKGSARGAGDIIKLPGISVAYIGGPVAPFGMAGWVQHAGFQVVCEASSALDSGGDARKASAGAYALALGVLRILAGKTLGLEMSELTPKEIEPIEGPTPGRAIFGVEFRTRILLDLSETQLQEADAGTVDDLDEVTVEYEVEGVDVVADVHVLIEEE